MNGKATSNVGQRVALWPVFPHEKHFTSYFVGAWAPVVAIVAQRSTFEAMFLAPEAQPASEEPVSLFTASDNNSWTNLSLGDSSGALAGGGTFGVRTANNFFSSSSL